MSLIRDQDLKALTQIGNALWPESARGQLATAETLAAVSTLTLEPGVVVDRAGYALLQRAARVSVPANLRLTHAFFRLNATERAILAALHIAKWSYERIGRLTGLSPDEVAALAWSARLELVAGTAGTGMPHPVGSGGRPDCPPYDPRKPWTQTFLDAELKPADQAFLQGHLMACRSCRQALQVARKLYYAAEARVPRARDEAASVESIRRALRRSDLEKDPTGYGIGESLLRFFSRRDVFYPTLAILAALYVASRFNAQ